MTTSIRSEATRSVVVVNGADKLAINEDGSLELLTPAANPTGNDVPTAGQLPFTKEYTSPEQVITLTGALTLAHGLGAKPKVIDYHLVCKTADAGYSVGDEVKLIGTNFYATGASISGISVILNATNLIIRYGNATYPVVHATTGAAVQTTPANWRLVVRAWA